MDATAMAPPRDRGSRRLPPVHPPVFAMAFVVALFVESGTPADTLLRPLAWAGGVTLIGYLVLAAIVRRWDLAALLATLILTLLLMPGIALVATTGAVLVLVLLVRRRIPVRTVSIDGPHRLLDALAIATLAVTIANAYVSGALVWYAPRHVDTALDPGADGPDIYVILMDAYPRADTLLSDFGFDDGPFLQALGERGFEVVERSHANYDVTPLTVATMLNAEQIPTLIPEPPSSSSGQFRLLTQLINDSRMATRMRELGYEIVTIPSPSSKVTMYTADRVLESDGINDLELTLIGYGGLPRILPGVQREIFPDMLRGRLERALTVLPSLAGERGGRPKFVFAHLMSPHPPILYGSDGSERGPWPCFPERCNIWNGGHGEPAADIVAATVGQIEWINASILSTVDQIQRASDRPPVIVLMSDHGYRQDLYDKDETLRSFLAVSTPNRPGLFPSDATPVNILPRLLNAYAGTTIALSSEESYWIDLLTIWEGGLLRLEAWDPDQAAD
jgi:hypothetical protein